MKHFVTLVVAAILLCVAGCSKYDDTEVWNSIDSINARLSAMEVVANAYKNNLYITSVETNDKGHVITFSDGSKAVIEHGKDGVDGKDGIDGKDGANGKDGINGKDGADGEDGKDGEKGEKGDTGPAGEKGDTGLAGEKGEKGDSGLKGDKGETGLKGLDGDTYIASITIGDEEVTFELTDNQIFSIARYSTLSIAFDQADLVEMPVKASHNINFTVTSNLTDDVTMEVVSSSDMKAEVSFNKSTLTGTISVTSGDVIDKYSKVVVLVSNGEKMIMKKLTFNEKLEIRASENSFKPSSPQGGEIGLEFLSNVEPEVTIPEAAQSWVSVSTAPVTRALSYSAIVIILQPNSGEDRSTTITIRSTDGSVPDFTYTIEQKSVASSDEDAQTLLDGLYTSFMTNIVREDEVYQALTVLFNEPGDDLVAGGESKDDFPNVQALNHFSYNAENSVIRFVYERLTNVIYDANMVLDRVTSDTPAQKRIRAEARSLRAWAQFMLTIGWGTPPLVDDISASFKKTANYTGGHDGLLEWCAQEAEAAAADLDERESQADQAGAAKVTKGFAYTLAGKARLFMKDYTGAKTNLKKVIDSSKYALVPAEDWPNLFHVSGDLNEEKIFEIDLKPDPAIGIMGYISGRARWQSNSFWNWRIDKFASLPTFIGISNGWGSYPGIRKDFAQEMLDWEGNSPRRKATFLTPEEFLYEMEWNGTSGMSKSELEKSDRIGIRGPSGLYGMEGYFAKKTIVWSEDMANGMGMFSFQNFTIFRYAEVLLMYAEACAQTSDSDGLQYLNEVQTRAGAPVTTLTLDNVKKEKKYEMWLEGVRWPDMVRWGDTDGVVDNGKSIPTTYDARFTKNEEKHRIYVEYSNPNLGKTTGFKKDVHEYFPYPENVILYNPGLVQNPSGM
ncbi:MAG: RagB/SusD family nutrient uptake outer membrane protein [Prevotellaceae bacterium]|jgi:hypothetical protein|nr:RagB/SusD family nutrient uptake outer membrane protein [Prevotellaceae bacterium]